MKLSYAILPDQALILQRYSGPFSLQQIIDSIKTVWDDPRYSKSFNGIIDLSSASMLISISEMQALIQFFANHTHTPHGKWATVVNSPISTAFIILYQKALAHKHDLQVFSTMEAACKYVNTESATVLTWFKNTVHA
ncbi:MAG: hypothetical protein ABI615_05820 [Chthoniobacterales bacterium]